MTSLITPAGMATYSDDVGRCMHGSVDFLAAIDAANAQAKLCLTDIQTIFAGNTEQSLNWSPGALYVYKLPSSGGFGKPSGFSAGNGATGSFGAGTGALNRGSLIQGIFRSEMEWIRQQIAASAAEDGIATVGGGAVNDLISYAAYQNAQAQVVTLLGSPTGGTFTITYAGQTTANIAYNATASTVQTALQAILPAGTTALVSGSAGGPYTVALSATAAQANGSIATATPLALSVSGSLLTGGTAPSAEVAPTLSMLYSPYLAALYFYAYNQGQQLAPACVFAPGAQSAVQTLTISGAPTGGTFTLTFLNQTTTTIAYNASASAIQTALQGLGAIGSGNALVTSVGGSFVVTFAGALAFTPVPLIVANGAGLTGGTNASASVVHTALGSNNCLTLAHFAITGANTGTLSNNASTNWPTSNGYATPAPTVDNYGNNVYLGGMPMPQAFAPIAIPGCLIDTTINGTCAVTVTALNQAGVAAKWTATLDSAVAGTILHLTPAVAGDRMNAIPSAIAIAGTATAGAFDIVTTPERIL